MAGFIDIVTTILSGGATGLIGGIVTTFVEYKKQQLMYNHEVKKIELEQQTLQMEIDGRMRIAETEADAARDVADSNALSDSYDADRATYTAEVARTGFMFQLVDFIRGIIRPGITIYLAVIVTLIYMDMKEVLDNMGVSALNPNEIISLHREIILSVIYVTTTVILWWFGTRNKIGSSFISRK